MGVDWRIDFVPGWCLELAIPVPVGPCKRQNLLDSDTRHRWDVEPARATGHRQERDGNQRIHYTDKPAERLDNGISLDWRACVGLWYRLLMTSGETVQPPCLFLGTRPSWPPVLWAGHPRSQGSERLPSGVDFILEEITHQNRLCYFINVVAFLFRPYYF